MKGDRVGEFEELVLLAVMAHGEPAYAVPVQRFIEKQARRPVSMGAVYAALSRLADKGLLSSAMGDATPQPGGKRKRLYQVSPEGERALSELRSVRERIWRAIEDGGGR